MRSRIGPRKVLRLNGTILWIVLLPVCIVSLYFVGRTITPMDDENAPQVLSPHLRAVQLYRTQIDDWNAQLIMVDQELTGLLGEEQAGNPAALYSQGERMQEIGEVANTVVYHIDITSPPAALVALRNQSTVVAEAYLESARLTAVWLGEPSESNRRSALEALRIARALRLEWENSAWMN